MCKKVVLGNAVHEFTCHLANRVIINLSLIFFVAKTVKGSSCLFISYYQKSSVENLTSPNSSFIKSLKWVFIVEITEENG